MSGDREERETDWPPPRRSWRGWAPVRCRSGPAAATGSRAARACGDDRPPRFSLSAATPAETAPRVQSLGGDPGEDAAARSTVAAVAAKPARTITARTAAAPRAG